MRSKTILNPVFTLTLLVAAACGDGQPSDEASVAATANALTTPPNILVVVRSNVYSGLSQELATFTTDLMNEQWAPVVVEDNSTTPAQLKHMITLAHLALPDLAGVFLVGAHPTALVENPWNDQSPNLEGACDYYYMDLDGDWRDQDNDSHFDYHGQGSGTRGPELFVGRLDASNLQALGKSELDLYRAYFARNHAFRTGTKTYQDKSVFIAAEGFPSEEGYLTPLNQQRVFDGETLAVAWQKDSGGYTVPNGTGWGWSVDQLGIDGTNGTGTFQGEVGISSAMVRQRFAGNFDLIHLESHGWAEGWDNLLSTQDVVAQSALGGLPGFVLAHACTVGDITDPVADSVVNTLVLGGSLGAVANSSLGLFPGTWDAAFMGAFGGGTVGQGLVALHNASFGEDPTGTSILRTSHSLLWLGDPTLRYRYPTNPAGCTESNAVDLGAPGNNVTVSNDGCVKVTTYPVWWGSNRIMKLEDTTPGTYPVPFSWTNSCANGQGSGTFTADWQPKFLAPTSSRCTTLIDLKGSGAGSITLRYWG
jgi:hypothetical protein